MRASSGRSHEDERDRQVTNKMHPSSLALGPDPEDWLFSQGQCYRRHGGCQETNRDFGNIETRRER